MKGSEFQQVLTDIGIKRKTLAKLCGVEEELIPKEERRIYYQYTLSQVPETDLEKYEEALQKIGKSLYETPGHGPNNDLLKQINYTLEKENDLLRQENMQLKKDKEELKKDKDNLAITNQAFLDIIKTGLKKDAIKFDVKASGLQVTWADEKA